MNAEVVVVEEKRNRRLAAIFDALLVEFISPLKTESRVLLRRCSSFSVSLEIVGWTLASSESGPGLGGVCGARLAVLGSWWFHLYLVVECY